MPGVVALAVVSSTLLLGAGSASAVSAPSAGVPGLAAFSTWTSAQAVADSPLIGSPTARLGTVKNFAAAQAFSARVTAALPQVEKELGAAFVSAAIDPITGTRLVVNVDAPVTSASSPTLNSLNSGGGTVTLVKTTVTAAALAAQSDKAIALVGSTLGGSQVIAAAQDDMSASVVVGFATVTANARTALAAVLPQAVALQVTSPTTSDGGTFGNNALRAVTPVAAGQGVVAGHVACSTALTATKKGVPVVVTAGHCGPVNTKWTVALNGRRGKAVGSTSYRQYSNKASIDAALISAPGLSVRHCIVRNSGPCMPVRETGARPVQGSAVLKDGSTTGETKGVITAARYTYRESGDGVTATIVNGIATSTKSGPGDSGGTLWQSNGGGTANVLGILNGGNSARNQTSFFTNYSTACHAMGIDKAYCP